MKINRKTTEKDGAYPAYKEVEGTVTSFFEIAKDLQVDPATVVFGLKIA